MPYVVLPRCADRLFSFFFFLYFSYDPKRSILPVCYIAFYWVGIWCQWATATTYSARCILFVIRIACLVVWILFIFFLLFVHMLQLQTLNCVTAIIYSINARIKRYLLRIARTAHSIINWNAAKCHLTCTPAIKIEDIVKPKMGKIRFEQENKILTSIFENVKHMKQMSLLPNDISGNWKQLGTSSG